MRVRGRGGGGGSLEGVLSIGLYEPALGAGEGWPAVCEPVVDVGDAYAVGVYELEAPPVEFLWGDGEWARRKARRKIRKDGRQAGWPGG